MGWQTDWLYQLIFAEIERLWQRAMREGRNESGPAPNAIVIDQMPDADWNTVVCRGDPQRRWLYSGDAFEAVQSDTLDEANLGKCRGMFYETGLVQFHISQDRKRVLLNYVLGPRYGRGKGFDVHGQGLRGELLLRAEGWIS